MKKSDEPIVVEEIFSASVPEVWKAITELKQMRQWFFGNIESFEPLAGFETKFPVESGGRVFPHLWKVTEVNPPENITINWKYEGYEGNSFVRFELSASGRQTILRLTHRSVESFPSGIPEFSRKNCSEGWDFLIRRNLKAYLENTRNSP